MNDADEAKVKSAETETRYQMLLAAQRLALAIKTDGQAVGQTEAYARSAAILFSAATRTDDPPPDHG